MKSFIRTVSFFCTLIFALSACTKEVIEPSSAPIPSFSHGYDDPWCSSLSTFNLVDDAGNLLDPASSPYGELVIANHEDHVRFMVELSPGWFLDKSAVFVGNSSDIPMTQNGFINTLLMPIQSNPIQLENSWTDSWTVSSHNAQCMDVVYWCEVLQLDFFTGPIQSTRRSLWAKQSAFANGFMLNFCYVPCPQFSDRDVRNR